MLDAKNMNVRKDSREGLEDRLKVLLLQLIKLNPLAEHTFGSQALLRSFKKFLCEKAGRSRDPRVGRLRNNDVVFLLRHQQMIPGIIDDQLQARVRQGPQIGLVKELAAL